MVQKVAKRADFCHREEQLLGQYLSYL